MTTYKIDEGRGIWEYGVYKLIKFGPLKWWWRVYDSDYFDHCRRYIDRVQALPVYVYWEAPTK
jgi:hypothetical protein